MADDCLVFVHIPKSAGHTMNSVLRRQYKRSETIDFNTLEKGLDGFANVPVDERTRARLVRGHVHYGIHRWLPREARYITVLRDPIQRVLSLYSYVRREPRHPLHDRLAVSGAGLEEFVETGMDRTQVENGQTRQIAGIQDQDPTPDDLKAALSNLRKFVVVGLMEQFDESLILMKRMLGWRTPYYVRQNVGGGDAAGTRAVSSHALELIRQRNDLDLALYSEARLLFQDLVARQDESFSREVSRFKMSNRFTEAVGSRVNTVFNRVRYSAPVDHLRRIAQ